MKHKLLKSLLLLSALVVGSGNVWAAVYTAGYTPSAALSSTTGTVTGTASETWSYSITFDNTGSYYGYGAAYGWQLGAGPKDGKNRGCRGFSISTSDITGTITKIEVEAGSYNGNSKINVTVGGNDFGTQNQSTYSGQGASKSTFTGEATGEIVISATDAVRAFYLKSIVVTYTAGSTPSTLALTGDPITLNFDLYNNNSAQVIDYTTSGSGAVSVVVNDYVDATVNTSTKKITITPKKVTGSAQTITVNQTADATYAAGNVTFKVNITDSTPAETFEKITSADDLATGDELIFVNEAANVAAGTRGSNTYLASVSVTIDNVNYEIEVSNADGVNVFVLGGKVGAWTLYSKLNNEYLKEKSAKSLGEGTETDTWTITFSSGNAVVTATNPLRYNSGSPRFTTYESGQQDIQLYRKVVDRTHATVGAAGYTTYVTKGKVAFPGEVKAYIATAASGSYVTLQKVASAPANTAVVIEADADDYTLTTEVSPANCSANILKVSNGYVKGNGSTIYALGVGKAAPYDGQVGFYLVKSGETVPAGKAYLTVAAPVKEFLTFDFDEDDADGINSLTPALSEGEGEIYNLAGQRLQKMQKGINIVNGKKIFF